MDSFDTLATLDSYSHSGSPTEFGFAKLEPFSISEGEAFRNNRRPRTWNRYWVPGKYHRLTYMGEQLMSDTPLEVVENLPAIRAAHNSGGRILLNGLGMGLTLRGALSSSRVTHVDVVEINGDVLRLISRLFPDPRVDWHNADALHKDWPVNSKWDFAWHDIWSSQNGETYQMHLDVISKFQFQARIQGCLAHDIAQMLAERV